MKKLLTILFLFLPLFLSAQSVIYIATDGNDLTGDGNIGTPYATLQKAVDELTAAGDTIIIRGGTYNSTGSVTYKPTTGNGVNGTEEAPVVIMGYPGEWPIFDCRAHTESYNGFVEISHAQHIHFKDFEVKNIWQTGPEASGVIASTYSINLEFDHIILHDISTPRGYYIQGGAWKSHYEDGDTDVEPYWDTYTDTTRWTNCDVYNICDTLGNGNAGDGWWIIFYRGNYIEFNGCRAWNYSDDAVDFHSVNGAQYVINDFWAWPNDYSSDIYANMEHNGWKMPPSMVDIDTIIMQEMRNCIVVGAQRGIYELGGGYTLKSRYYNNFAYRCGTGFEGMDAGSILRNNISYKSYTWGAIARTLDVFISSSSYVESHNTWDKVAGYPYFGTTDSLDLTDEDFISLDPNELIQARKEDGSLPDINFGKLRNTSDLRDAGIQPYSADSSLYVVDSAGVVSVFPDIGVWEYTGIDDSSANDILDLVIYDSLDTDGLDGSGQYGYEVIDTDNHTVTAEVYAVTDLTKLRPSILVSDGATVVPASGSEQDFSGGAVAYTVTSADLADQVWNVAITKTDAATWAHITKFDINVSGIMTQIDTTSKTVAIFYSTGTSISSLAPNIETSRGSTISPLTGVTQDFTTPVVYTLTAEDGITEIEYTIYATELTYVNYGGILGYTIEFLSTVSSTRHRGQAFIVAEEGYIESISIYHKASIEAGSKVLAGIYNTGSDGDPIPDILLEQTDEAEVNDYDGWQTIDLRDSLHVSVGDTIWVIHVFENSPGVGVYSSSAKWDNANFSSYTYPVTGEMQSPFEGSFASTLTIQKESVYVNYTDADEGPPEEPAHPTVQTTAITTYNAKQATIGCNVISDGGGTLTAKGVCFSTSVNPTTSDRMIRFSPAIGSVSVTAGVFKPNTTYHVRAYATNETGTSYGADVSFTTPEYTIPTSGGKFILHNGQISIIR